MTPQDDTHEMVRTRYAEAARSAGGCCGQAATDPITTGLYDQTDRPSEAALAASLGCGNPTALAELAAGEDVLDLGSGGGLDVLLSARRVGPDGTAYGLDMTDEMLDLARRHQADAGIDNARFLKGTIEQVPLDDETVDVIISNCVINLSPDKDAVIREAHRVLRPGGRFAVSDIVLLRPIPAELRQVVGLWTGCISGSLLDAEYTDKLAAAGFADAGVEVTRTYQHDDLQQLADLVTSDQLPDGWDLDRVITELDGALASAFIRARKAHGPAEVPPGDPSANR